MPAVKKQRIGRPRSKSAPAVLRSPKSPIKRKQWSYETMVAALEAVKGGRKPYLVQLGPMVYPGQHYKIEGVQGPVQNVFLFLRNVKRRKGLKVR